MTNKILGVFVFVFLGIQFFKPERNLSNDQTFHIETKYPMPEGVKKSYENACNDCHSNATRYPWYASIQPFAWWLNHHVTDGKRHYNVSEYTKLPIAVQNHKFEETIEMIEKGEMPMKSYTWFGLHKEAQLTSQQKDEIIAWAHDQMDAIKAKYPADSLVMKRRPQPSH